MNNVYLDYYKILWNFYVKFMSKFEVSMRNQILLGMQTWSPTWSYMEQRNTYIHFVNMYTLLFLKTYETFLWSLYICK